MKNRTISLIIPAFNEEKNIGECLNSVIKNASHLLLEILVVDNGSEDKTLEIARSFSNVKVFTEEGKGVMHARQRGIKESTGDILVFVDADNRIPAGWIEIAEREFTKNSSLVCLSGPYKYYDLGRYKNFLASFYWKVLVLFISKIFGYVGNFGNMFLTRDVLLKMDGLDTSIIFYGDDTNTAKRASRFGKVIFNPKMFLLSSGRRFESEGFIRMALVYTWYFLAKHFSIVLLRLIIKA